AAVFGLVMLLVIWFERSPVRREAIANRDQHDVAAILGVATLRGTLTTFVVGSAIAAVAGSIFVHRDGFATPDTFGIDLGLGIFVMLLVGGAESPWGALLGAWFYTFSAEILNFGKWSNVVYGVILVVVILLLPGGLIGIGEHFARWLLR